MSIYTGASSHILGTFINPQRACAARVTVVGFVCPSVKAHLTSRTSVCPEIDVTNSTGSEGQNICGVFFETAPLWRSSTPSVVRPAYSAKVRTVWVWAFPSLKRQ